MGVIESDSTCDMKDSSIPRLGKVWLRGRWKWLLGTGRRACWVDRNWLSLGENVKGVVGVVGPPEKEEGAESVKALDKEVALWELVCL